MTVQSAKGDLTAAGDAQGTATIIQFGQLIEVEFVLAGGELYIKGVTGGFTQVPAALAGSVYDPSAILDPDQGVAKVLSSVQSPTIAGTDGDSWLVSGTRAGGRRSRAGPRHHRRRHRRCSPFPMGSSRADRQPT